MENILVNIDSTFRDISVYPNPGKFTYTLDTPLKNILYVRLSSIELPTTFYTFNSQYNNITFTIITEKDNIHEITIKEGNYESTTLISYIQTLLDEINKIEEDNLTITWDSINYKVRFISSSPFSLIFGNTTSNRTLGNRLGFRGTDTSYLAENQSYKFDKTTNIKSYYWVGETFLDTTKDDYLFIKINDYGIIYNNSTDKSLLAKIILYDQQFILDNEANFLTKSYYFRNLVNISKLDIELINSLGQTIDMNLINFSLTLEFGQVYNYVLFKKKYGNIISQPN